MPSGRFTRLTWVVVVGVPLVFTVTTEVATLVHTVLALATRVYVTAKVVPLRRFLWAVGIVMFAVGMKVVVLVSVAAVAYEAVTVGLVA